MPEPVRYLREDILSGTLSEVELEGATWEETLNRPGSLSASMSLHSDQATEEILDPWRTALYVLRGTNVEWGGILTPPSLSLGGDTLSLSAFGWLGYWDHRVIRTLVGQAEQGAAITAKPIEDATSTNVDPLPQGSTMWANVAGGYSARVGIVPQAGNAGTWRAHFSVPTTGLDLHPIASVTLGLVVSGVGATAAVNTHVRIGSTDYPGGAGIIQPGGVYDLSFAWTTNPATGVAWTPADVYAFNTGGNTAGFTTGTATTFVDVVVNQVWLTVSYGAGFSDYFANTDQFEIFKQLIDDAQSQTRFGLGYDLGIDVTWEALSGVRRDRTVAYTPWLAKNLGEELRRLSALVNGFDYAMEYTLNPATDRIDKTIRLSYPHRGRTTGFRFEYEPPARTNVLARGFADPVNFAWVGDGWGSGNDATRLKSPYTDETKRGVYPPYDAAPTWSSVVLQSTLDEHTNAAFARTGTPRRIPVLAVDPDLDPTWGAYGLGDEVLVSIRDGYGSTPEAVPQRVRITGWRVTDTGTHELVLADPLGETGEDEG